MVGLLLVRAFLECDLSRLLDKGARVTAAGSEEVGKKITGDAVVATSFPPLNCLWGGVNFPTADISEQGETNPSNTARGKTTDTRAAEGIATNGMWGYMVLKMLDPAAYLRVHDAGTVDGCGTWGRM